MRKVVAEDWSTFNAMVLQRARRAEAGPLPPNNALVSEAVSFALSTALEAEGTNVVALSGAASTHGLPHSATSAVTATTANQSSKFHGNRRQPPRGVEEAVSPQASTKGSSSSQAARQKVMLPQASGEKPPSGAADDVLSKVWLPTIARRLGRRSRRGVVESVETAPAAPAANPVFRAAPRPSKLGDLTGVYNRLRTMWSRENTLLAWWQRSRAANPNSLRADARFALLCFLLDLFWYVGKAIETFCWIAALLIFGVLFVPLLTIRVLWFNTLGIIILWLIILAVLIALNDRYGMYKSYDAVSGAGTSSTTAPGTP
jgi:hypothetical protein